MSQHLRGRAGTPATARPGIAWRVLVAAFVPLSLGLIPHPVLSAPDAVQYELQERCGKRAAEVFEKDHPQAIENVEDGQTNSSYRNHYDPDLNKCFLLQTTVYIGKKNGTRVAWKDETLIDVNDNKEYGNLIKRTVDEHGAILMPNDDSGLMICMVFGLHCVSERQWEQMIGRYMGDRD
jgi:hypothetical protein